MPSDDRTGAVGPASPLLRLLFLIFLKIGSTAWGGFMPLIAAVQSYVRMHDLLDEREVLDAVFLASVLPGPTAVNMVTGVGYRIRGLAGAAVCWLGVLLPTFVLVAGLSVAYFHWGKALLHNSRGSDSVAVRHPEVCHPIERRTADEHLGGLRREGARARSFSPKMVFKRNIRFSAMLRR